MQRALRANAYTQWGTLKRIMVGQAGNDCFQPIQPSQVPKINDPTLAQSIPWPKGAKHQESIERANVQLNYLKKVLQKEGIEVVRPDPVDWRKPIKTPWWEVENQYGIVCPRDSIMTCGNIIMESSMSRRDRFFEVFALRRTVEQIWNEDPDCLWKAAPKSSMRDDMYDASWHHISEEERAARMASTDFGLKSDQEIVFDAADFTRTGKHIFGQVSMTCNENALKWLHRELSPFGFVVHPLRISYDTTPSHIDCTFVVLKPGLVMTNPARPLCDEDKKLWFDNGWKLVESPWPENLDRPLFSQSSYWLNMNVLVISPDKVIVEAGEPRMQAFLASHGFEVIPVPFRDVYEFGGSLHCATWDIERDDAMIDLFPNFDINKSKWHQELRRGTKRTAQGYHSLPKQSMNNQWTSTKENLSQTHLEIDGHPVMERWETPYMAALAREATKNGGTVLEIGFGMGISATAVQQCTDLVEHKIIELNNDVYNRALEFKKKYPKVCPMLGNWSSQLEKVENDSLDGVLYDTYPLSEATQHIHQFEFIKDAKKKLKLGGILTYCNLTSLGVLRKTPKYDKADLTDTENWNKLFEETQKPHLLQAGWDEDEISWSLYELPAEAIKERNTHGCDYYTHSSCLVPHLVKKR